MLDIALTEGRVAADVGQEIASELGIDDLTVVMPFRPIGSHDECL